MREIVVATGLSGFIGSNLLPRLYHSFDDVISVGRGGMCHLPSEKTGEQFFDFSELDITDSRVTFYNLATCYDPNPKEIDDIFEILDSNIVFPLKILSKVYKEDLKIINFCSYLQLSSAGSDMPYCTSKDFLRSCFDSLDCSVSNVYLFDTFGKGDKRNKVVDVFIRNILNKRQISIPENDILINLSNVDDVCDSLVVAPTGMTMIKSPFTVSLGELILIIEDLLDCRANVIRQGVLPCHYSVCTDLPFNIYCGTSSYNDFLKKLESKCDEIRQAS